MEDNNISSVSLILNGVSHHLISNEIILIKEEIDPDQILFLTHEPSILFMNYKGKIVLERPDENITPGLISLIIDSQLVAKPIILNLESSRGRQNFFSRNELIQIILQEFQKINKVKNILKYDLNQIQLIGLQMEDEQESSIPKYKILYYLKDGARPKNFRPKLSPVSPRRMFNQ